MKLTLGKKTNKELAEFFGCSEKTVKNKKKQKLEELQNYAEFYEDKGKVVITKVKKNTYQKPRSENYRKVKDGVDKYWPEDGIGTCPMVSNIISKNIPLSITDSTRLKMVQDAKKELFGTNNGIWAGEKGYCHYAYGIYDEQENKYRALTEEEEENRHKIWDKYYGHIMEDAFNLITLGIVDEEISMKDLVEKLTGDSKRYQEYTEEVLEKVGYLSMMTKVVRNELKSEGYDFDLLMGESE